MVVVVIRLLSRLTAAIRGDQRWKEVSGAAVERRGKERRWRCKHRVGLRGEDTAKMKVELEWVKRDGARWSCWGLSLVEKRAVEAIEGGRAPLPTRKREGGAYCDSRGV